MWVLDQTVVDILRHLERGPNFFVLMLGTHSQISHFVPDHAFPSERYFDGGQFIPSVFCSLSWDSGIVFRPKIPRLLDQTAQIRYLVRWSQPSWLSLYNGIKEPEKDCLWPCIRYAIAKLLPPASDSTESDKILSVFRRLHLDFDFVFPSCANKLVSSK